MEKFRTATYEVHNPKIKKSVRFAVLADLHGSIFGEENNTLLKKIQEYAPDAILLAGDMVVRMDPSTLETARKLLCTLAKNFPIFYAMGNHETKMKAKEHIYRNEYLEYQAELKQKGICFLANEKNKVVLAGNSFVVNGLELPLEYYHKPFSPKLTSEKMEELMGKPDPEAINILLAHNPKYGRTYFRWGADLILSGHYHGGVLRFSRHVGAISSQFIPFPKYCCGDFYKNGKCMIVSAGLGEHTVPLYRNETVRERGKRMAIPVKLNVFEGPLDLLLHLIDKNKIDIYDIPIVEITDQYMEYIHAMEKEDLGVMSEFMVMAATLLDIKCRMLLPKEINEEGEEEDPRAELVQKLLEYKMYKYMSYELKDKMDDASGVYFREPDVPREVLQYREPVDPSELLAGLTLEKLNAIYQSIIRRQDDRRDPIRSQFGKIEKEEVSLSDKMLEMKEFAKTHRKFSFRDLLKKQCSKVQVIVTFLSVLELIKMGHIHVVQEEIFDDIQINVVTEPETWKNLTEFAEEEG